MPCFSLPLYPSRPGRNSRNTQVSSSPSYTPAWRAATHMAESSAYTSVPQTSGPMHCAGHKITCVSPGFPSRARALIGHGRSEEHTSELQSRGHLVCRLLLEKKNTHYTLQLLQA